MSLHHSSRGPGGYGGGGHSSSYTSYHTTYYGGGSRTVYVPAPPPQPPVELLTNCTKVPGKDSRWEGPMAGFIVGIILCAFIASLIGIHVYKMHSFYNQNDKITAGVVLAFLAVAIGGMGYAIQAYKDKYAKERKESFPITSGEVDVCKKFMEHKYVDSTPEEVQSTSGGVVALPAGKVIRKIKIYGGGKAQLQLTRTGDDGKVKTHIIENSFDIIKDGYQCNIDAVMTTGSWTVNVVVISGSDCKITYMVGDLPAEFDSYVKKYDIVGRRCENGILSVDKEKNDVVGDECWCEA